MQLLKISYGSLQATEKENTFAIEITFYRNKKKWKNVFPRCLYVSNIMVNLKIFFLFESFKFNILNYISDVVQC